MAAQAEAELYHREMHEIFKPVFAGGPDGDGNFQYPPGPLRGIWQRGTAMRPNVTHPPGGPKIEMVRVDLQVETISIVLATGKLPPKEHTVRNIARDVMAGADAGALTYLFLLYANSGHPGPLAHPLLIAAEGAVAVAAVGGLVWAGLKRGRAQRALVDDILARKPRAEALQNAFRESVEQRRRDARLRAWMKRFSGLLKNGPGIDDDSIALVEELAKVYLLAQENDPKSYSVIQHLTETVLPNDGSNRPMLADSLKDEVPSMRNKTIREAAALAAYQWEVTSQQMTCYLRDLTKG